MAEHPRVLAATLARTRGAFDRVRAVCRDVLIGAAGTDAYANYLAHLTRHHPDLTPLSREAFASDDLSARWNGIRRCC